MRAAVGQFAVGPQWQANAARCCELMREASQRGTDLLVLPEAVLARSNDDPFWGVNAAQPLEGEFIGQLRAASRNTPLTTVFTLHTPAGDGRVHNTLVVLRNGEIVGHYHKLHLYDAFGTQESARVSPGESVPPLIEVAGMRIGLMTCYDLRFPELALSLALAGAEAIVLPAAWVRGAHKEQHWATLLAARALDSTCYMLAAGECGPKNIGHSRIVSPLGVTLAGIDGGDGLIYSELDPGWVREVRAQLPVLANRRFSVPVLTKT